MVIIISCVVRELVHTTVTFSICIKEYFLIVQGVYY